MLNEKEIKSVFDQAMNIWINPEIERKKQKGWLKEDFQLYRAQIIFTPNKKPQIRFNESVKVTLKVKANRNIVKGEEIKYSDLKSIEEIIVDNPPNAGHITLIYFLDRWVIVFDARNNKKKIRKFIEASKEFYESAKEDLDKKRLRPFFENCWASAELSSACHLLSMGQEYPNHRENLENFKQWGNLGNVDKNHVKTLSRLNSLRKSARYMHSTEFKNQDPKEFLETIEKMIKEAEKLIRS